MTQTELTMKTFLLSWGLIIISALFDTYAAFIVKMKFNQLGPIDFSSFQSVLKYLMTFLKSPILISAVITFALAPCLWFLALNRLDLSIGYPSLVGFHLVFILIFGIFFLGEPLTLGKVTGVVLVMISFFFLHK